MVFAHGSVLEETRTLLGQEGRENIQLVGYYQVLLSLCTSVQKGAYSSTSGQDPFPPLPVFVYLF